MGVDLQRLYNIRFKNKEKSKKNDIWGGICAYLANFLPPKVNIMVDVAAGYCEFINNIPCNCKKVAYDVNEDINKYAKDEICVLVDDIANISQYFSPGSVTIFFMSNFLEHINKDCIDRLFAAQYELLEPNGEIWILTPNIRYVGGKYWDFYDHITPITEKALIEIAGTYGFRVKKCISKFLPFTTKSKLPQATWIVRVYLRLMPLSGYFFGEQSFIILQKRV